MDLWTRENIKNYTCDPDEENDKKDWNRNVFTVRTNDDISLMIKEYCHMNKISTNHFLNNLLKQFFEC